MLSFLLGGVDEAGSSWRVGFAVGVLAWLLPARRKGKAPFLDCDGSTNGAGIG